MMYTDKGEQRCGLPRGRWVTRLATWIDTPSSSKAAPPSATTCSDVWREMAELGGGMDWVVILGFFVEKLMECVLEIFTIGVCK
jgi:hypothetical protein